MLIEVIIDGVVYVEQRSYFVYRSMEDRKTDKAALSTSDEDIFIKHKKATFVNYLKNKLQTLVERNPLLKVKVGIEKTIKAYIIETSEPNAETDELMCLIDGEYGMLEDIVFVDSKHTFEFEPIFEL